MHRMAFMDACPARPAGPKPSAHVPPGEVPQRAGAWALGHEIGRGGTSVVYAARHRDARRGAVTGGAPRGAAAVKVARDGLPDEAAARFADEARMLATFDHDGIVRMLGSGQLPDGRPYIAMTRAWGEPVTRHTRRLPVSRRLAVFRSVCHAVAEVHRCGIVHCDLKPGNVFVALGGRVTLLDFGIARAPGAAAGALLLTPDFAAPEQLLGETLSLATDVYALGLLLHDVLCGSRRRVPWGLSGGGPTVFSGTLTGTLPDGARLAALRAAAPVTRADGRTARLTDGLRDVLATALHTDPARRYSSAACLARAVERAAPHAF